MPWTPQPYSPKALITPDPISKEYALNFRLPSIQLQYMVWYIPSCRGLGVSALKKPRP